MAKGEFAARQIKKNRKKFRWKDIKYKRRQLGLWKKDPLKGAPQGRGIVIDKRVVDQKKPTSGLLSRVSVSKKEPKRRAINAGIGSEKKIQAWAPMPERDRSTATDMLFSSQTSLKPAISSLQLSLSKSAARKQHELSVNRG